MELWRKPAPGCSGSWLWLRGCGCGWGMCLCGLRIRNPPGKRHTHATCAPEPGAVFVCPTHFKDYRGQRTWHFSPESMTFPLVCSVTHIDLQLCANACVLVCPRV